MKGIPLSKEELNVFEKLPDLYLVLSPDLFILTASDAYLGATLTRREEIAGKYLFDVFPDNPQTPQARSVQNLSASLQRVLSTRRPHQMDVQQYDIPRSKESGGGFERKYWKPSNTPVLDPAGAVRYIIHKVHDVTGLMEGSRGQDLTKRTLRGFLGAIIVILVLSGMYVFSTLGFVDASRQAARSRNIIFRLEQLISSLKDIETGQRGYILTHDRAFLEPYYQGITRVPQHIQVLDTLKNQAPRLNQTYSRLQMLVQRRIDFLTKGVQFIEKGNDSAALALIRSGEGKATMDQIRSVIDQLQQQEIAVLSELTRSVEVISVRVILLLIGSVISVSVVLLFATFRIRRDLKEKQALEFLLNESNQQLQQSNLDLLSSNEEFQSSNIELVAMNEKIARYTVELRQQASALEQSNKELEFFSYSVSHDLRSPLRAITGYGLILQDEYKSQLPKEASDLVGIIIESAYTLGQLIDGLLEFSRLGRQAIRKMEVNMKQLVEPLWQEIIATLPKEKNVHIHIQCDEKVFGDPQLLKQVWRNLLNNAIKFTSHLAEPQIQIGCFEAKEQQAFFIKDNGIGFKNEYSSQVFEIFKKLNKEEEYEGTGIGLAIVQRIIEAHGGRVWAEAQVNKGATFYFSLPRIQFTETLI
jgi:signal transduction histidine kinase